MPDWVYWILIVANPLVLIAQAWVMVAWARRMEQNAKLAEEQEEGL